VREISDTILHAKGVANEIFGASVWANLALIA
jgi:hypothetical protein